MIDAICVSEHGVLRVLLVHIPHLHKAIVGCFFISSWSGDQIRLLANIKTLELQDTVSKMPQKMLKIYTNVNK